MWHMRWPVWLIVPLADASSAKLFGSRRSLTSFVSVICVLNISYNVLSFREGSLNFIVVNYSKHIYFFVQFWTVLMLKNLVSDKLVAVLVIL